ncbi:hypothetical protein ACFWCB_06230 [Streptomyces sp. NPDC060048]|uniref:hypothetical protein n=1 Tax=unclassified Streptomyces TaxID=2593676 RepID=UPI0036B3D804
MNAVELVRIEAGLHDWAAMECGCGYRADHIPGDLIKTLEGEPPSGQGHDWADNHAFIQSNLMEPAVATAAIAVAALAGDPGPVFRKQLITLLGILATGEQEDVAEACVDVIRGATWILYEELFANRSIVAAAESYDLLGLMDEQSDRLRAFHRVVGANLPEYLR